LSRWSRHPGFIPYVTDLSHIGKFPRSLVKFSHGVFVKENDNRNEPRTKKDDMSTQPKLFTEVHPIEASTLPRPGTPAFQKHIDELVSAATELMKSTPTWKSKGRYHGIVEVRERMDWRGKRNWFVRRSVHKDVSFETFKVSLREKFVLLILERALRKSFEE